MAYQVDLACLTTGRRVEHLTAAKELGGKGQTMQEALGGSVGGARADGNRADRNRMETAAHQKADPGRFRQGLLRVKRKVRIPESGVW